jgi:hypothetical protein
MAEHSRSEVCPTCGSRFGRLAGTDIKCPNPIHDRAAAPEPDARAVNYNCRECDQPLDAALMAEEFEDERDEARAEVERLRDNTDHWSTLYHDARDRATASEAREDRLKLALKKARAVMLAEGWEEAAHILLATLPAEPPEDARAITDEEWNSCPCGCDVRMDDPTYAGLHGDNNAPAPEAEPRPAQPPLADEQARYMIWCECDNCGWSGMRHFTRGTKAPGKGFRDGPPRTCDHCGCDEVVARPRTASPLLTRDTEGESKRLD